MRTQTVGILGYADDWVLYTRNHQILRAQNNMQAAFDIVAEWSEASGFRISRNTKAMHICRIGSKPENHSDPAIRFNRQILVVVDTHRKLGLIMNRQLTWRPHIETVKAKGSKRLNLLRHVAGTQLGWGRTNQPYRSENLLIEAGESTLQQRREIKTANMAVKITTKPEHPINRHLNNKKTYNQ
jgi:hypothetical protein